MAFRIKIGKVRASAFAIAFGATHVRVGTAIFGERSAVGEIDN